jgi:hypothetical protein
MSSKDGDDWVFTQIAKSGHAIGMVWVGIDDEGMSAYAEDGYYNGRLTKSDSLALARAIIAKLDPDAVVVTKQLLDRVVSALVDTDGSGVYDELVRELEKL